MKKVLYILTLNLVFLFSLFFANAKEIGFVNNNIWLSNVNPLVGDNINIFAILINGAEDPIEGEVKFLDIESNAQIGDKISFQIDGNGTSKVVFVPWTAEYGDHRFKAQILNAYIITPSQKIALNENTFSNVTDIIFIDVDTDSDGLPNRQEIQNGTDPQNPDTDGDGFPDNIDPQPLIADSDNDGLSNETEMTNGTDPYNPDTDHDGLADNIDPNPLNPDTDGDGEQDGKDPDPSDAQIFNGADTDKDGIPDSIDSDIDNDGLYNWEEEKIGTSPYIYDSDTDGFSDSQDYFPTDPLKQSAELENDRNLTTAADRNNSPPIKSSYSSESEGLHEYEKDIDNDGLYNWVEIIMGTDPYKADTDDDGVSDKNDPDPLNPTITNENNSISILQTSASSQNVFPKIYDKKLNSFIQSHSILGILLNISLNILKYLIILLVLLLIVIALYTNRRFKNELARCNREKNSK